MAKDVLVLCAGGEACREEITCVGAICATFKLEAVTEHVKSVADIAACLAKYKDRKWKYIYLDAHADRRGFGSADDKVSVPWTEFASALCQAHCLEKDAILFLACCRVGLKSTAHSLFENCDQIAFVCGPHWRMTSYDLPVAFHVLIYNLESRCEEPLTAVERASLAVGFRFMFYERSEWEDTYGIIYEADDPASNDATASPPATDASACCPTPFPLGDQILNVNRDSRPSATPNTP